MREVMHNGKSVTITLGQGMLKKNIFPWQFIFFFYDIIYKRFPQVSFPFRVRSFENTAFSQNKSIWQCFFKPSSCWKNLGFIEIKFIRPKQKTVSGAQTTVINSHLLMPHVTADGVLLLIHFFHQSPNTVLYSSASGHREGLGCWTVFPTEHLFLETVLHVLLTLFCSISSGMQRHRAQNQRQ